MSLFFDTPQGLLRILIIAPCAYAALVLFLRISGKRTLTQLNAFDLVVTVALGSVLATLVVSKDTPLMEGLAAMALLIGLQWLVAYSSVRSKTIRNLVRSQPTALIVNGRVDADALRRERVTQDELLQAVKASGRETVSEVKSAILQTNGTFAVVGFDQG